MSSVDDMFARARGLLERQSSDAYVTTEEGKQYLPVSVRLKAFREAFGASAGIVTQVAHMDGPMCIVRAEILIGGSVVASGMSYTIIDPDNPYSGVETAETSAIGRALACLGLGGKEYASADEIAKAKYRPAGGPPSRSEPDMRGATAASWAVVLEGVRVALPRVRNVDELEDEWRRSGATYAQMQQAGAPEYEAIRALYMRRKKELTQADNQ